MTVFGWILVGYFVFNILISLGTMGTKHAKIGVGPTLIAVGIQLLLIFFTLAVGTGYGI